jgi:hypothetical protein
MNKAWLAYAIASCTSFTALIVACSGSSDTGLLGAAGTSSGTNATSSGTTATSGGTSGATSGGTSGATSGGTSGTIVDGGGPDAEAGPPPTPCNWAATNPCGAGLYCSTKANQNGCGAGFCVPIPTTDTNARSPVCGCDGITYWNDAVAAKHAMSFRKQLGPCPANVAVRCGGLTPTPDCRAGASCNHKVASKNQCDISLDRAGDCWQLPTQCPPPPTKLASHACESVNCTDECNLIKLMTDWYEDTECP